MGWIIRPQRSAGNAPIIAPRFGGGGVTPTINRKLFLADGATPAANLSSLNWAFFDQNSPSIFVAPSAKGTGATTDAGGNLALNVTGTTLSSGQNGWLDITDSDGNPTHNCNGYSGPQALT